MVSSVILDVWKYVKVTAAHYAAVNVRDVLDVLDVKEPARKNAYRAVMMHVKAAVVEHVLTAVVVVVPDAEAPAPDVVEDARAVIMHVWDVLVVIQDAPRNA